MKASYKYNFYADRHQKTVYSAQAVLTIVLDMLPPVHSAIDFGCGVGTWLSVLKEQGVSEIRGLDGPWVDQNLLEIKREEFQKTNFEKPIVLENKYDLAISLEVAEHVSQKSANTFVDSLVGASDFVLFSAAIPFQGGIGHINEQWPNYWVEMFAAREYFVVDHVRKRIWNDGKIPVWYRQNIFLFIKSSKALSGMNNKSNKSEYNLPLNIVHPNLYLSKVDKISSVRGSFNFFQKALRSWVKKMIKKQLFNSNLS